MSALLEVRNISLSFKGVKAINDLSFAVQRGGQGKQHPDPPRETHARISFTTRPCTSVNRNRRP